MGNSHINASKDKNLTRLLNSFHRDRPKGHRGIPSWNLSLVLHQLTKAPFEPVKEASLKHQTFRFVFLLALGSGKCTSEIHAWLYKNIRHQIDWSKVALYHSPSFISKNQLAKEGADSVAPVVIPARPPLWINHSRLIGHYAQLEPCATIQTGPWTSGKTKKWSLSPSRKVWTMIYFLSLSHHRSSRLWSCAMNSLIKWPLLYIR